MKRSERYASALRAFDERGLAGAVQPNESEYRAGRHCKTHRTQRNVATKFLRDSIEFDGVYHSRASLTCLRPRYCLNDAQTFEVIATLSATQRSRYVKSYWARPIVRNGLTGEGL
jgi:hypothetical protein